MKSIIAITDIIPVLARMDLELRFRDGEATALNENSHDLDF